MPAIYRVPVEEYFNWQRPVIAFLATPPGGPAKGDRYIVDAGATDAWVGRTDQLAWFDGSVWQFDVPVAGCGVFDIATATFFFYIAGTWTPY